MYGPSSSRETRHHRGGVYPYPPPEQRQPQRQHQHQHQSHVRFNEDRPDYPPNPPPYLPSPQRHRDPYNHQITRESSAARRRQAPDNSRNAWERRGSRPQPPESYGRPSRTATRDWAPASMSRPDSVPYPVRTYTTNVTTRNLPVQEIMSISPRRTADMRYSDSPPPMGDDPTEPKRRDSPGSQQYGEDDDALYEPYSEQQPGEQGGSSNPYDHRDPDIHQQQSSDDNPPPVTVVNPVPLYRRSPSPRYERPYPPEPYPYEPTRSHRPESPMSDTMEPYDNFEQTLASLSASQSSNDGDLSDPDTLETEETLTITVDTTKSNIARATNVYTSHYTGNAELGGTHNGTLTVLHDPKGQKHPLFRWLHVRQNIMNLDEFWTEVSHQSRLNEAQKAAITKLRANVKKHCVKSQHNPKGSKVGYMVPRFMEVPLELPKKKSSKDSATGSVKWVCIPYFTLLPYSGLLAASNINSFPSQTLLQAQYSRTPQQRDMEQAVSQLGTANRGECFHIAQLWCLIIDNSFIVTCGSMSQSDLQGESLQINSEPSREPTATVSASSGRIFVSYGESVLWSFTAAECPTWFSFISHFQAFWPDKLEFKCRNRNITAETWPKVLASATRPGAAVTLKLRVSVRGELAVADVLEPEVSGETVAKGCGPQPKAKHLPVLTLLDGDSRLKAKSTENSPSGLTVQLAAAEKFLAEKTSSSVQKTYTHCGKTTRDDVYAYLAGISTEVEQRDSDDVRRSYKSRVAAFNAADMVYRSFFPANFDGPTVSKFWGKIKAVVKVPELEPDYVETNTYDSTVVDITSLMKSFLGNMIPMQSVVSHANVEEQATIDLPHGDMRAYNHAAKADDTISRAARAVINEISYKDLLDKAAVLPLDVFSLVSMELLSDQVGKSDDILETYSQYLNMLDTDITTKPSDRAYQHRISLVQQEMTAIKRTLARQRSVIGAMKSSLLMNESRDITERGIDAEEVTLREKRYDGGNQGAYYSDTRPLLGHTDKLAEVEYIDMDEQFETELASATKLSPTDPAGFRGLLLTECARLVDQREYEFRRYTEYAEDLERAVLYKMDWTKDRQENAIYAFTLVTIIFLPLSSIASIFGMNTSDVRDMPFGQWLYWATALPVTLAVILGGLWWMNELDNVTGWVTGQQRRRSDPTYPTTMMPPPAPAVPELQEERPTLISAPTPRMERTYETAVYEPPVTRVERIERPHMSYPSHGRVQQRPPRAVYRY